MDAKPTARTENLIIEELDRGAVVYDSLTQQAHALDPMAATVWRAADGHRTISQLAEVTGLEEPAVVATLDQLRERGLVEAGSSVSRRAMLRRTATLGAAAIAAAPLIETVVIPTAAAHASTGPPPPQSIECVTLTPDNLSVVANVPMTLPMPGRFLIRRGNTKVFSLLTSGVFGITVNPLTLTFTNDLVNSSSYPPYHFQLTGTDGSGKPVNVKVAGVTGASQDIPIGPLLRVVVHWVSGS